MTKRQAKSGTIDVKALLAEDEEFLRTLVRAALQEVLEAQMTEALGAIRIGRSERQADQIGQELGSPEQGDFIAAAVRSSRTL